VAGEGEDSAVNNHAPERRKPFWNHAAVNRLVAHGPGIGRRMDRGGAAVLQ
jgi:hypothetical protein